MKVVRPVDDQETAVLREEHDDLELLTAADVAQLLKVEVQSVYRWASQGTGPRRVKLGGGDGPVRYRRGDVRAWIAERTVEPAKAPPRRRSSASRTRSHHQAAAPAEIAS